MGSKLLLIGAGHCSLQLEDLRRWVSQQTDAIANLHRMRKEGSIAGGVVLATCNRMEILVAESVVDSVATMNSIVPDWQGPAPRVLKDESAVRYLTAIATGLESMAIGEDQILGQVKRAFQIAEDHGLSSGSLRTLQGRLLRSAREIRERTGFSRAQVSLADVAARHLLARGRRFAVVGAGETGRRAAETLVRHGAEDVVIVNRTLGRACRLAEHLGCRAMPLQEFCEDTQELDGLLIAIHSPEWVIGPAQIARVKIVIDLSMPSVVAPEAKKLKGDACLGLDDLADIARQDSTHGPSTLKTVRSLVEAHAGEIFKGTDPAQRSLSGVIELHVKQAMSLLDEEFLHGLKHLDPKDCEKVRLAVMRSAKRNAHFHIQDLKQLTAGGR